MKRRWLKLVSLLVVSLFVFTGCTIAGKNVYLGTGVGFSTVFRIGELTCKKNEALTYLLNYRNIYGTIEGTDFFGGEYDTERMESNLKDAVLSHLTQVYAMNQYAGENEITLDSQELSRIESVADEYYNSLTEEERSFLNVNQTDIREMYERLALAEKTYTGLLGSVDEEISEDEARVVDAQVIVVSEPGAASVVAQNLIDGYEFSTQNSFNHAAKLEVSVKRGDYPQEVEDSLFALDDGEWAGPVEASDGNYYFVKCISKYNAELSEENKKSIVQSRQSTWLSEILEQLDQNEYSELNTKIWNEISLENVEDYTTDSFFTTLHATLSYE